MILYSGNVADLNRSWGNCVGAQTIDENAVGYAIISPPQHRIQHRLTGCPPRQLDVVPAAKAQYVGRVRHL